MIVRKLDQTVLPVEILAEHQIIDLIHDDQFWHNFGYRSQALRGLLFTGGDAGRAIVEATAVDVQSPFNSIARLVLSRGDEN